MQKRPRNRSFFGLPGENRTHNTDLGGPRYIHLTTERYMQFLQDIAIPTYYKNFYRGHQIGHQILF